MRLIITSGLFGGIVLAAAALPAFAATTYGPPTPPAFPTNPFQASVILSSGSSVAIGPGGAPFGITSITLASQSSAPVQVNMFQATTSGAKCSGTITSIGGSPDTFVIIPADQTVTLPFPTPLIIAHLSGQSCIGFDAIAGLTSGNNVAVLVNGFQN